ncbi:vacuolar protein sorting-associated protein [Salix suchowensis]|nr:vacuolar protein sorting-associated protein [Salix suchowensis]
MRDLLSSFYSPDHQLLTPTNLSNLIKNLDTDLQMLVYENYNKFIMPLTQLKKRENIGNCIGTRNLLRKFSTRTIISCMFIYDLPSRLGKCIKSEAYADAVRFYIGAMPILRSRASEEAMAMIIKNLQGKLFSDSESIQARAEAAVLLKQLDFPVDSLKAKLFEKLEQSLDGLQLTHEVIAIVSVESSNLSEQGNNTESVPGSAHGALVSEFAEAVRAYQIIFPDSEIIRFCNFCRHFEITSDYIKKWIPIANFLGVLRIIWKDVLLIDTVLHEALLSDYSSKVVLLFHTFSHLLHDISDALTNVYIKPKEKLEEHPLVVFLEAGKSSVLQGSVNVLLDFRQLLEENLGGLQLSDLIVDWVQEGFQDFFRALHDQFLLLSGKNKSTIQDENSTGGMQVEKVVPGLVLVLAQLSVFIERTAISRITEEIAAYFSGGGGSGTHENGPAFVPGEICRTFHSAGEMLLQHYINMRTQRISILLRKRFTTPNWFKHKEPREVHMFVDLFLQELEAVESEAKQILPHGVLRKHRRSESNGSSASSLSNSLRDDKMSRSNTHRARSQLLEKHLAKLFKQKVEIFTKTEYNQESVVTTVVKLCLKSLQEFVRLQTFNRSGFQQIQLDVQFLRAALKEIVEDEAAVDFLLDEVIVGASERCLDPIPLEPPILDKLIQVKLAKEKEQTPISP